MHRFMCMYVCIFIHTLRYTRLQETHATYPSRNNRVRIHRGGAVTLVHIKSSPSGCSEQPELRTFASHLGLKVFCVAAILNALKYHWLTCFHSNKKGNTNGINKNLHLVQLIHWTFPLPLRKWKQTSLTFWCFPVVDRDWPSRFHMAVSLMMLTKRRRVSLLLSRLCVAFNVTRCCGWKLLD